MDNIAEKIILQAYLTPPKNVRDFDNIKRDVLRGIKNCSEIPRKNQILKVYHKLLKQGKIKKSIQLEQMMVKRSIRTLSGVAIITVLTKPYPCPGSCVYCPFEKGMPKSYLSSEPAAARAKMLKFDPYEQVARRTEALEMNGHPTGKIELIVKGGSWNAYPTHYQYWFILRCFEACNKRKQSLNEKQTDFLTIKKSILKEQKKNETAKHRIIGLTLETRPDLINEKTVMEMRDIGATRIEMGAQSTDDKILKKIQRGHDSLQTKKSMEFLKNAGFKVDLHIMPQLPGTTPKKDLEMMLELFKDPGYRPDMIKVYPCTVLENTVLYDWYKSGEYKPYSNKNLIEIISEFKNQIPYYTRISRLIRDIPSPHIKAGNKLTNLRQDIQKYMGENGMKCRCLRCREVGHIIEKNNDIKKEAPKLFIEKYNTRGGTEYFLSLEDKNRQAVFAFCRLRILDDFKKTKEEYKIFKPYPAYIRELHTYGQLLSFGSKNKQASQHKGMGQKLIKEAEKITTKHKAKKLAIISGVGVRGYYRQKLGYRLENGYMVKKLNI